LGQAATLRGEKDKDLAACLDHVYDSTLFETALHCAGHEIDAMPMRLMLLRHAKSEKAEAGQSDRERRLDARGQGDAPVIGAYMAHHALIPDLVLVSAAARTRETWERLAAALAKQPRASFEDRLYNAGWRAILAVVKETAPSVGTLMVVGHNPGLHELARHLIASGDVEARERLHEKMPTSSLVVIDFAGKDWRKLHTRGGRLAHFITPRSLAAADQR
jgi:phosphohistidine phosphatase